MTRLLVAVAVLALAATGHAADLKRFKLQEPIAEPQVFACRERAPAESLARALSRGEEPREEVLGYLQRGLCGIGAAVVTYRARTFHERADGHEYTVYEGGIGGGVTIWVIMIDWTHEGES